MKRILIMLLTILSFVSNNKINAQENNNMTMLYPVEATATKYGQTIKMPDLSGLPLFSATYDRYTNKVIVRRGDRRLTLSQSNNNYYYRPEQYGSLTYSMQAYVYNGTVSKIIYTETEDNVTVKITYLIKWDFSEVSMR